MLAKVHKGKLEMEGYSQAQSRALELQKQLLLKLRGELPEAVALQRERTAAICFDLAEQSKRARQFDRVRRGCRALMQGVGAGRGWVRGWVHGTGIVCGVECVRTVRCMGRCVRALPLLSGQETPFNPAPVPNFASSS